MNDQVHESLIVPTFISICKSITSRSEIVGPQDRSRANGFRTDASMIWRHLTCVALWESTGWLQSWYVMEGILLAKESIQTRIANADERALGFLRKLKSQNKTLWRCLGMRSVQFLDCTRTSIEHVHCKCVTLLTILCVYLWHREFELALSMILHCFLNPKVCVKLDEYRWIQAWLTVETWSWDLNLPRILRLTNPHEDNYGIIDYAAMFGLRGDKAGNVVQDSIYMLCIEDMLCWSGFLDTQGSKCLARLYRGFLKDIIDRIAVEIEDDQPVSFRAELIGTAAWMWIQFNTGCAERSKMIWNVCRWSWADI